MMKRRNKSCLGVFVIGLFTVYIFIVYRWFFRESAGDKIQQDNLPTDSGMMGKKGRTFLVKKSMSSYFQGFESMHQYSFLTIFSSRIFLENPYI